VATAQSADDVLVTTQTSRTALVSFDQWYSYELHGKWFRVAILAGERHDTGERFFQAVYRGPSGLCFDSQFYYGAKGDLIRDLVSTNKIIWLAAKLTFKEGSHGTPTPHHPR
jgi:hypothetical protein